MNAAPFRLSAEQLDRFDQEGYLVLDPFFTDAELQPVIEEIEQAIDHHARELVRRGVLSSTYGEEDFEHRLARISAETDQVALAIWNGSLAGPGIFQLIRNPRLLDVAEQLCGPELIASSVYRLRPKIPRYDYGAVPWHQDSGYTEPFCDAHLMVTVWLPLVDATPERGCLWVIPGVHRGIVARHRAHPSLRYLEIPSEDLPTGEPVCVPVLKGGVLFLTNRTPHASFENSSDVVRWSMDLRYQSAELPTNAPITRLPGEAVPTDDNDVPPACYPPEADFLVRSRRRPEQVVTDPEEFRALREKHVARPVTRRWR